MKKLSILAAAAATLATLSVPAFAATEAELRARCTADGGTPSLVGNTISCNHPGPAPSSVPAAATPTMAHTFEFEGKTWTIVEGPPAAVSAVHMVSGSAQACPSLKVRFEPVPATKGPAMTAAQKFRGDQRWHVVCVW